MFTVVIVATALVVTMNVVVVLPAGTITEDWTCAAVLLLLERLTAAPPTGATPFSVTVPVELLPPVTNVGLSVILDSIGGFTVRVAFALAA